jgi:hypothetical protein
VTEREMLRTIERILDVSYTPSPHELRLSSINPLVARSCLPTDASYTTIHIKY